MPRPVAGNIVGLVIGVVLLLVFWVPLLWIGPSVMFGLVRDVPGDASFPGGSPVAYVLLGFILAIPVVGLALALWSLFELFSSRRRRMGSAAGSEAPIVGPQ